MEKTYTIKGDLELSEQGIVDALFNYSGGTKFEVEKIEGNLVFAYDNAMHLLGECYKEQISIQKEAISLLHGALLLSYWPCSEWNVKAKAFIEKHKLLNSV